MQGLKAVALGTVAVLVYLGGRTVVAYDYITPFDNTDISWLPLGNSQGHITAVVTPVGLPIITTLRQPGSGRSVMNGQTELKVTYKNPSLTPPFDRRNNWGPWDVCFSDGMQPVVSYQKDAATQVVWPLSMVAVSREWVQESNILRTVIGTADFELTVEDFICSDRDGLVRTMTLKNLMAVSASFRLINFAPINPSGREMSPWVTNWKQFGATNRCQYDAGGDCLLFTTTNSSWWVVGADRTSSGHHCAAYPGVATDIADGALSGGASVGPAVVEGALSYDSPVLAQNESYTVTSFVTYVGSGTSAQAVQQLTNSYKSTTGDALRTATLAWWQSWLAQGTANSIADPVLRTLVRRLLMVVKACIWDIGGISAVPGELCMFYTRDAMPPARALALYGYPDEAKRMLLALEAYMTFSGNMNFQSYNATVSTLISTGFSGTTSFTNITSFSMDDPALIAFTIGEIWRIGGRTDTQFITQTWPFIKHLVAMGERDMGSQGVIAQNGGFQDDMLHWAFLRPGSGISCSYFNMLWVSALELAAEMGTTLGHTTEAAHYTSLAASIRTNIESTFWSESMQRYAYIHVPDNRDLARTDFTAVSDGQGGRYIYPNSALAHGASYAHWCGYADDARARASLAKAKASVGTLPAGDLIFANYSSMTARLTRTLYGEAVAGDAAMEDLKDWIVRTAPLAGMPENYPTNNRAVQLWMCGETLVALRAYVDATVGAVRPTPTTVACPLLPKGVAVREFDLAGRLAIPGPGLSAGPAAPGIRIARTPQRGTALRTVGVGR